jgi:uncharacterized protein
MTAHYQSIVFSEAVKAAQEAHDSRKAYARQEGAAEGPDRLSENEAAFIASRDSFYMATIGAGGWPYMQHRGGPPGFVRIVDPATLAIADFRGNRQYITVGNAAGDGRVSLFFMDYARRTRLKMLAHMRIADLAAEPELIAAVVVPGYKAVVERAMVFRIEAFEWNCPQHITPRFTMQDIDAAVGAMRARIAKLEAELAAAKG